MRENVIEKALVKAVKQRGGLAIKFTSVNFAAVPDRIVLLPNGMLAFIELKAPGKKMRPLQEKRKRQLTALGFTVLCIDNKDEIEVMLDVIYTT